VKTSRWSWNALVWGLILVVGGSVLVLFNVGILKPYQQSVAIGVAALLAVAGLYFLVRFAWKVDVWWPTIPGFTLWAMAAIVYLAGTGNSVVSDVILASLMFVGLGLAFLVIFIVNRRQNWWAWITSGALLTMFATLYVSSIGASPTLVGAVIFGGMAVVFALLYLLVPLRQRLWWAPAQAGAMALAALIVFLFGQNQNNLLVQLWPVLLVIIGVFLIGRQFSRPAAAQPTAGVPTPAMPKPPSAAEPTGGAELTPSLPEATLPEAVAPAESAAPATSDEAAAVEIPVPPSELDEAPAEPEPSSSADEPDKDAP